MDIAKDGMLQLIVTIPPQFSNGNEPKEATFLGMTILKLEQLLNALSLIVVTDSGKTIFNRLLLPLNADFQGMY